MGATLDPVRIAIDYKPRIWARAFHASLRRFSAIVLHRRAGKTTSVINHHQRYAMDDGLERRRLLTLRPDLTPTQLDELVRPPGGRHYGHIMPLRTQAKLVVWDKLKHYARPIPGIKINESELLIRYPTGHKFQLFGADDPDALRGPAFSGVSFDEFSQMPGNIYSESISKALADHLGYAVFLGTIKGKDQLYETYQAARTSEDWFSLWQDVDRSLATEEGITIQLLEQAMADDRKQIALGLMTQDEYDQEWFLSADAAIKGAWFLKEMAKARTDGRITRVPVDRMLPVDTDWDLGIADAMSIWFTQSLRSGEIRVVDYYEATGEGLPHYVAMLTEKGYVYGKHHAPHDIKVRELGSGKSRMEVAAALGLKFQEPQEALPIADGIQSVRLLLAQCWFDEERTALGIECLRQYRKAFNTRLDEFTGTPVHNWASHGADAFRTLAQRYKRPGDKRTATSGGHVRPVGGSLGWAG
jgi:phage terminase large subunit